MINLTESRKNMGKVVVTDYSFETLDTEKQILEPLGCEVLGYQCKSTEELIPVVADADYVITQFAPVNFDVINAMKKCKIIVCNIIVFDPVVSASDIKNMNYTSVTLDELFEKSDLIILHCPSNPKTRYMINKESLKKMKKGVLLVNTSRGTLIKSDDLIEALKNGKVAGAGLDVTDPEPINSDSPLLKMENVIITNHVAACSVDAMNKLQKSVADTVACAVRGEKLPNVVNNVQV